MKIDLSPLKWTLADWASRHGDFPASIAVDADRLVPGIVTVDPQPIAVPIDDRPESVIFGPINVGRRIWEMRGTLRIAAHQLGEPPELPIRFGERKLLVTAWGEAVAIEPVAIEDMTGSEQASGSPPVYITGHVAIEFQTVGAPYRLVVGGAGPNVWEEMR